MVYALTVLASVLALQAALAEEHAEAPLARHVIERYRTLALKHSRPDAESVRRYVDALTDEGTWADIDYDTKNPSSWQAARHMSRLREMALALVADDHELHGDPELRRAVNSALGHWLAKRYRNTWWWDQIGVPRNMRDVVVLLDDELTGDARAGALEVIGQHKVGGSGANLVWTAELALHHACLSGEPERAAAAAARVWQEVTRGAPQGIQPDNSFYQHGPRLQAFHYGRSYLQVVVELAWQLRGTPWAMPADKQEIVSDYILDGLQWMCRGTYTVPSTLDRAVSRRNSLGAADLRWAAGLWREVDARRLEELDALLARQNGTGGPLVGFRHFPRADFTTYHCPAGSLFLKTVSDRTRITESINSENLKGVPYLHSGDHYVLADGGEYHNLQPVWDWSRLPGLTTAPGLLEVERRSFVGGVGDGSSGLAAMDYVRTGENGARLVARKAWVFRNDLVICLMGGWDSAGTAGTPWTSLEQCRLRGPVQAALEDGEVISLAQGQHRLAAVRWLLHNGIGYVPLGPAAVSVQLGLVTGSWHSINRGQSDAEVTEPVFAAALEHGPAPAACGFVVVLGTDAGALAKLTEAPPWDVLRNDAECQCIRMAGGRHFAACYAPTGVAEAGFGADAPCLAMWSERGLWLCDPTQEGRTAEVRLGDAVRRVDLPPGGTVLQVGPDDDR